LPTIGHACHAHVRKEGRIINTIRDHRRAYTLTGTVSRRPAVRGIGGVGAGRHARAAPAGAVGVTAQLMGAGQPASAPGLKLTRRRLTVPGVAAAMRSSRG
jgi:hypothetical protein